MNFIIFLLIGAVAGWLAGQIKKGYGFGLLGNILVGVAGGVIGGWLADYFRIGGDGLIWQILIATGGALILLFLISLVRK